MVASPLLTTVRMRVLLGALCTLWVTAPARAAPQNAVRRVEVKEEGATTTVAIRGTQAPTFTVYKLERPERVVVDVASARLDGEVPLMTVGGWAVTQVSTQALGGQEAQTVRVLVGFARPATYRVKAVGSDVVVTVVAREPKPEAADPVAMRQAEAARTAAEKAVADADGKRLLAERQVAEAEARARALESAKSAEAAQARAAAQQAEARRAAAEQAAVDAEARARAVAADADAKRARAEKQAADAEARARTLESARATEAAQARAAAQQAEARRAAAEKVAADAEARARAAEGARAENATRARAEAAQAEARRAAAEKAANEADARRVAAERAANEADAKRQAAETARQAALAARTADEQAAARAEAARAQADARREEAEAALAKVEAARAQAETARLAAETQRQKAEEAAKAAAALAQNARASAEEIARARGEAERLARQQKDAEGALAEARKLRAAEEQRLAAAEARRREATEEAQRTLAQATADADRTRAAAAEEARRKLAAADAAAAQAETLRVAAAGEARTKLAAAERAAAEAEKTRQAALAEARLARAAAASEANEERARAAAEAKQKLAAAERAAAEAETARQAVLAEAERTRRAAAADAAKAEGQRRAALAEAEQARRTAASDAATAQAAAARAIAEAQKAEKTRQAALAEAEQARRAGRVDAENARRQAAAEADTAKRAALAEAERARLAAAAEVEKVRQLALVESEQARMLRAEAEKARAAAATAADEALRARGAAEAEAKQRLAAAERVAAETEAARKTALAEAETARKAALAEAAKTRASAADDARRTKGAAEEEARQKLAAAERAAADAEKARQVAVAEAEQARKAGAVDADRARAAATAEARQKLAAAERAAAEAEARAKRARDEASALAVKSKVEGRRSNGPEGVVAEVAPPVPVTAPPAPGSQLSALGSQPSPKTVALRDVDYVDRPDAGRVVLELDGPAAPVLVSAGDKQAVFELPGVTIPARLTRALDVRGYEGPVATVSTFTDGNGRARVVVDLTQPAKPSINKKGNQLTIDFARPMVAKAEPPKPAKVDPAKDTGAISYNAPIVGGYGVATTPVTAQTVAQQRASVRGQRIEIDVVDADIHNLMRLIAQAGNVDVIIPEDVRGNVTVRLTRVPWKQAMEVILESKGLWYKQDGNIIRVATRKDLDAEEQAERERQRSRVQEERPETEIFTLNYANAGEVLAQVTPLLSPRGKAVIDTRTNSLVLTDISGNRGGILRLLRRLDTQTPQIQIEARVVEARSTWRRQLGIQWGFSGIASAGTGNPTGLVFPNTVGVAGGNDGSGTPLGGLFTSSPNFAVNLPAATGLGSGGAIGFTFGSLSGNFNVALRLSAAEDTGTVRIISAPKITVLNNRPASISQGVSIPISVVSAAGVQTQFVPADLSLTTTPHVSQRDCSIQLDIDVKKNEADFVNTGARGDPSILRKEARTTMLIGDGETSVIGGIYTRNTGLSYAKVPWFADIPILGILFKNRRENDERTEVLIFLTPRITNKASLNCEPPPPGR